MTVFVHQRHLQLPTVIPAKAGIQKDDEVGKQYFVYILTSKRNGTLYTGITSNLVKRVWQHKHGMIDGFTAKYKVKKLVYYKAHNDPESAITREKQIKKWNRTWKLRLIEEKNPHWNDLYEEIL
jgi:putative endonuclease